MQLSPLCCRIRSILDLQGAYLLHWETPEDVIDILEGLLCHESMVICGCCFLLWRIEFPERKRRESQSKQQRSLSSSSCSLQYLMTSIGTGYDLSNSTFSPDGRVFQVEYAAKAVENAGTTLGIRTPTCVVIAQEKLISSKLLVAGKNPRLGTVDRHIGIASSGLIPDGKHFLGRARDEAASWRTQYNYPSESHNYQIEWDNTFKHIHCTLLFVRSA